MLIMPDKPAEGAACVVHLAATGDHGYARRTHLGLPLVQQVGWGWGYQLAGLRPLTGGFWAAVCSLTVQAYSI
jgi:hypothetical protein